MNSTEQHAYTLAQQWKAPLETSSEIVIDALLNHHAGIADMQELVEALHHAAGTFDQLGASVNAIGTLFGAPEAPQPLTQECVQMGSTLVNWDETIAIHTRCNALFEALRILVTHSKKAKKGAAITMDVTSLSPTQVRLEIVDNCGGISTETRQRFEAGMLDMFEAFGSLEAGLALSKRLVEEVLKGGMQIDTPYQHADGTVGTRYIFTIPHLNSAV